ncbi:MAG: DegQ family serine endoprotease [Deltaproteobacteria bacterium]|nr:DegQ family serine endoprotease [Deltaproteobacteria bacterium]
MLGKYLEKSNLYPVYRAAGKSGFFYGLTLALLFTAMLILPQALPAAPMPPSFAPLVAELTPAVVNINTEKRVASRSRGFDFPGRGSRDNFEEFFGRFFEQFGNPHLRSQPQPVKSLGSGFVISDDGYILTNNHVVEDADAIKVTLSDKKAYDARLVGRDEKTDLAVLKIDADHELPAVKLGDSGDLEVGDWVIAIGNPFGLARTVTAGIVSAQGRVIGSGPYDDFIQTDASINPGNSGGPLFNLKGEVVGINTAIVASGQGIGFAIPVNMAKDLLPQLKTGKVSRGRLGVHIQEVSEDLAASFGLKEKQGAVVSEVVADSPAARAGLEVGDIILAVDGDKIDEMRNLPRMIAAKKPGTKVELEVLRLGKTIRVKVVLDDLESESGEGSLSADSDRLGNLGLTVRQLTPEMAARYRLSLDNGVIISRVDEEGRAAAAGLRAGDVILMVNNEKISAVGDFRQVLQNSRKQAYLRFLVQRGEMRLFVVVKQAD